MVIKMERQLIVAISREFGSGGHVIARDIAERFGLPVYDRNLLHDISAEKNVDASNLIQYDEVPKNRFLSRRVQGHTNSPEENIAQMQFEYLKKKAASGESFVVIGRCAETVLKGAEGLITIFVTGDMDAKIERTAKSKEISKKEAEKMILSMDKQRKAYHNHYSEHRWGDSRYYDICINSSRLGIDETTEVLVTYIEKFIR